MSRRTRAGHVRFDAAEFSQGILYMALGMEIEETRKAQGLSQEELGDRVGLSRASISNIEGGRQQIYVHHLHDIARALGTSAEDILACAVDQVGRLTSEVTEKLRGEVRG